MLEDIRLTDEYKAIKFFRRAIKNETHKTRNIVLGIVFILIPILVYAFFVHIRTNTHRLI